MKNLHLKNSKNIFFLFLNINSVRNKFKNMYILISKNVDILIVAETKPESSFPMAQFLIPDFHHSSQLNITRLSSSLLVYVKGSVPARALTSTPTNTQIIVFEINLRNKSGYLLASTN